ncbi:hypothetical protein CMO88_00380 [Candidatus Woesearchaeota archaeon]|nr:hypothetical protein [Candidatus Woesearchaeota archaeon]|tara:strand:+ start:49977 stop:51161 length:1185 start_codon:yes stop_codon:yes gene_type:complete
MAKDYIRFSWKNIRQRGLRSWLTIIGIVIGISAIISLITIGQGVENAIEEQFEKLGVRNLRIIPANLQGPPSAIFTLPNDMIDKTESIRVVEYVDKVITETGILEFNNEEKSMNVIGYDVSLADKGFADIDVRAEDGRLFEKSDNGVMLIGNTVAKEKFDKEIRARNNIILEDEKFKVIGVFAETGTELDSRIYIPLENARDMFDRPDDINAMIVHVKEGIDIEDAQEIIERELLRSYDDEDFDILTPAQILEMIKDILGAVQAVLAGIATISLLVGAIGIMNAMFTSVLERTREIGVMKAIGAKNSDIAFIFLAEAGIMGSVGGLFGIVIGTSLAFTVELVADALGFPYIKIEIGFIIIIVTLIFSFIVGALSGVIPAMQAAKLKPVDALRYE